MPLRLLLIWKIHPPVKGADSFVYKVALLGIWSEQPAEGYKELDRQTLGMSQCGAKGQVSHHFFQAMGSGLNLRASCHLALGLMLHLSSHRLAGDVWLVLGLLCSKSKSGMSSQMSHRCMFQEHEMSRGGGGAYWLYVDESQLCIVGEWELAAHWALRWARAPRLLILSISSRPPLHEWGTVSAPDSYPLCLRMALLPLSVSWPAHFYIVCSWTDKVNSASFFLMKCT